MELAIYIYKWAIIEFTIGVTEREGQREKKRDRERGGESELCLQVIIKKNSCFLPLSNKEPLIACNFARFHVAAIKIQK